MYLEQKWGHIDRFKLPATIFNQRERDSQKSGTYIACTLRKLTCFSNCAKSIC